MTPFPPSSREQLTIAQGLIQQAEILSIKTILSIKLI